MQYAGCKPAQVMQFRQTHILVHKSACCPVGLAVSVMICSLSCICCAWVIECHICEDHRYIPLGVVSLQSKHMCDC